MNTHQPLKFQDFITNEGDQLTTDSRKVAAVHNKRHDDLLRMIRRRVEEAGEWASRNFTECLYEQGGRFWPMFTMTKDGYVFIMGRMTGKKAVEHQIAYIEAFNAMEAYIKNQREGLTYRCMAKELECKTSYERGQFHGRGLNKRKQEKPILNDELLALKEMAQPSLPLADPTRVCP
jgi:Rha family phage regulatory protein